MKKIITIVALLAMVGSAHAGVNLLVGDKATGDVRMYNPTTGAALGVLLNVTAQGFSDPKELAVGSDGNLYINVAQGIARYNSETGAYVDLWASSRHTTMTLDPATNTVYTASPGSPYQILQLVGGVESVFATLSNASLRGGDFDHSINVLNMGVNTWKVMAYSDVSGWDVVQSTTGGTSDFTDWEYLENGTGTTGLQETATNAYYNGGDQLRSLGMSPPNPYGLPVYNSGTLWGTAIDTTATIDGEVNLGPDGSVYYAAASEVRVVTGNAAGTFALFTDSDLTDAYGIAWQVPEPATMSLLALGGLALLRRKRR